MIVMVNDANLMKERLKIRQGIELQARAEKLLNARVTYATSMMYEQRGKGAGSKLNRVIVDILQDMAETLADILEKRRLL